MLDNSVFTNVKCELGKTINDGDREILVFATVPGLKETMNGAGLEKQAEDLKLSDDVVIEADVKEFKAQTLYPELTLLLSRSTKIDVNKRSKYFIKSRILDFFWTSAFLFGIL